MLGFSISAGKKVFSFSIALLLESAVLYALQGIAKLSFIQLALIFLVALISALGLAYVLYAVCGHIESRIIMKHKLEGILIATAIFIPIYYLVSYVTLFYLHSLVPTLLNFFEFVVLVVLLPVVALLIIVYILSA